MKHRTLKRISLFLLLCLLYVIIGALFPFAHTKRVNDMFQQNFSTEDFYGSSYGPDRASVVETSTDALVKRMQIINSAKERIILSTFDIRDGESVNDIFSAIQEAADRGVKVQILVDGLYGSLHMAQSPIFYALAQSPSIEIRFYNIPNPLLPWSINGRMHDKYLIVDDNYMILGGRNTFDYFLGEYDLDKLSYDRDVFIYNTGDTSSQSSVIYQVDDYFETMWSSGFCQTVFTNPTRSMERKLQAARETMRSHYQKAMKEFPDFADTAVDFTAITIPIQKATLISNPIHPLGKEPLIWYQIAQLMKQARTRVYLHTPYAVFSQDMYDDMSSIHLPEFVMLVNSTAVGDNFMASSDYTHNRQKILETGVTLYEYFGDLSSHGKSVLIDDDISLIGSFNLDMRSAYVNTEIMLVIHSEEFNAELEKHIAAMQEDSLLVASDGTYVPNKNVSMREVPMGKRILFGITSRLIQLIHYLI